MPLSNDDIERLKEIFVTRKECDENISETNAKLSKDGVKLAVIEQQLKTITWILSAVGGGIITMLIKLFLGG